MQGENAYGKYKKLIRRRDSERELFTTTSSTTFMQCTLEATEFGEITQNKGHYTYISNKAFIKYTKYYFLPGGAVVQ